MRQEIKHERSEDLISPDCLVTEPGAERPPVKQASDASASGALEHNRETKRSNSNFQHSKRDLYLEKLPLIDKDRICLCQLRVTF